MKYKVKMLVFYTDASFSPITRSSSFGVYCPAENFYYCSHLPKYLCDNMMAEQMAIENTIKIIKERFMDSENKHSHFLIYSDCLPAVRSREYSHESGKNIEIKWISRWSDGITVADRMASWERRQLPTLEGRILTESEFSSLFNT